MTVPHQNNLCKLASTRSSQRLFLFNFNIKIQLYLYTNTNSYKQEKPVESLIPVSIHPPPVLFGFTDCVLFRLFVFHR